MNYLFFIFLIFLSTTMKNDTENALLIFNFEKETDISDWKIVDDGVMGGKSNGNFSLSEEGNGVFEGKVSLENNGGFSSLRYNFDKKDVNGYKKVVIRLKGDGKRYQFRVKSSKNEKHSYIAHFETNGEWEIITLNLDAMKPTFRGRKLDLPNYEAATLEELAFLIGNKKEQNFKLEIDKIELIKQN